MANRVATTATASAAGTVDADTILNNREDDAIQLTGTVSNANGQTVTVTVSDSDASTADVTTTAVVSGGTFTVTTLGALGVDFFTPIVNPPQVAILGIGRVFPRLALANGQVEQRDALYLSLSFDHRALDGAPAARFLSRVRDLLELPVGLL